jgi:hypothetical protein
MAVAIDLTSSERRELGTFASRRRIGAGLAQRVRIGLLAAEGVENKKSKTCSDGSKIGGATRYDRSAHTYVSAICIAAAVVIHASV